MLLLSDMGRKHGRWETGSVGRGMAGMMVGKPLNRPSPMIDGSYQGLAKHAGVASTKLAPMHRSMVSLVTVAVRFYLLAAAMVVLTDATTDAEYVVLRTEAVVRIPSDVDPAAYSPLLCAGVTVFTSMRQLKVPSGEVVAIQGLGGLGHLAVQYANKFGFKVVALSSSGSKEKFAKDLGAHIYIDGSKENHVEALKKLGGAAMIVSTAPNPEVMGEMCHALGPRGKLMLLARKFIPTTPNPDTEG